MRPPYDVWRTQMLRWADGMISASARSHPFLGKEDLQQEASIALWMVWKQWKVSKALSDMQKIGMRAIRRRLFSQVRRVFARGDAESGKIGLDDVVRNAQGHGSQVSGAIAGPDDIGVLLRDTLMEALGSGLSDDAKRLLRAYVSPTRQLRRSLVTWQCYRPRYWGQRLVEDAAVSEALGWSPMRMRIAKSELRSAILVTFFKWQLLHRRCIE